MHARVTGFFNFYRTGIGREKGIRMYYLKTEAAFDSAHFLKGYKGKCSNIHGHRWRVVVHIKSEKLHRDGQTKGMVEDFGDIKSALKELCDTLDHCFIFEQDSLMTETLGALKKEGFRLVEMPFRPTAENLARYIYEALEEQGFEMHMTEVYETPGNCAMYTG